MSELTWVLTSSLLILAVIAIRQGLGRKLRPGLRYALWALVLVRLLYPGTLWHSPISVESAASMAEFVQDMETVRELDSIRLEENGTVTGHYQNNDITVAPGEQGTDATQSDGTPSTGYVPVAVDVSPQRFERMERTITARRVLGVIWLAGTVLTAALIVITNITMYVRLRKRRVPVEVACPVRVWAVEGLDSSCLFAGSVYINPETVCDEERLGHVLAHELSHWRHLDPLWAALRCAALAIHWYNPLVWYAAKLSRQDSELCADAGALKRLGGDAWDRYGTTLIELSRRPAGLSPLCAATTMSGTKKQLKERVTMIARRPRTTLAVALAALLIAAVAVGCAFAGGKLDDTGVNKGDDPTEDSTEDTAGDTFKLPGDGDTLAALLDGVVSVNDLELSDKEWNELEDPVNGGKAVLAEKYFKLLSSTVWKKTDPGAYEGYFTVIVQPASWVSSQPWKITAFQSISVIHLETWMGDVWLEASNIPDVEGIDRRDIYTTLYNWFLDARTASKHSIGGTPITAEDLSLWREELRGEYTSNGTGYPSSVNGFFRSDWSDPRDLDLGEFLYNFGWPKEFSLMDAIFYHEQEPSDDELADVYKAVQERSGEVDTSWLDALPCHKISAFAVDYVLEKYAGITLDDMSKDWRSQLLYLEKYNSFYTFTSDFGPGWFYPLYGERQGDILTLWSSDHVLTIRQSGDDLKLLSHVSID